jgi:SAM-dependent methyltransferase
MPILIPKMPEIVKLQRSVPQSVIKCVIIPSDEMKTIFSRIYSTSMWDRENPSGRGSMRKNALPYLALLQHFFNETSYTSVIDYGCGNWELMKYIAIPKHIHYLGVDIVKSVIDANIARYQTDNVHFEEVQSLADARRLHGDVLIAKDVLQHWSNAEIRFFLDNILVNFKMALLTNGFQPLDPMNKDISTGRYHKVDLLQPPFNVQARPILEYYGDERKRTLLWGNCTDIQWPGERMIWNSVRMFQQDR